MGSRVGAYAVMLIHDLNSEIWVETVIAPGSNTEETDLICMKYKCSSRHFR